MTSVALYRLSGVAVMVGMAIAGLAPLVYSRAHGVALYLDPLVPVNDLAKLFGSLVFLIGLPGLYAYQAGRGGRLAFAGFVLTFLGIALLEVSTEAMFAFVGPALAAHEEAQLLLRGGLARNLGEGLALYLNGSYLIALAGFVCFGIATLRAGAYPRWTGPVIAVGAVAAVVMAPAAAVATGPIRLDRIGYAAASMAFAACGLHLVKVPPSAQQRGTTR